MKTSESDEHLKNERLKKKQFLLVLLSICLAPLGLFKEPSFELLVIGVLLLFLSSCFSLVFSLVLIHFCSPEFFQKPFKGEAWTLIEKGWFLYPFLFVWGVSAFNMTFLLLSFLVLPFHLQTMQVFLTGATFLQFFSFVYTHIPFFYTEYLQRKLEAEKRRRAFLDLPQR